MAKKDLKTELRDAANALRDPLRLRVLVCGLALGVAFLGIYRPLGGQVRTASRNLKQAEREAAVARDVEFLQAQADTFEKRLGTDPDVNETVQYVLDGVRALPVKLVQLDSDASIGVGPYEAAVLRLAVSGAVADLDKLLKWLETDERLFRIDSLELTPPQGQETAPSLRLTLLALKVRP
jgi:hypothetical protein